jgi:hypothetical protein
VARDDFRIRIEFPEEGPVESVLERLHIDLGSEARHLARELEGHRLVVSRDGNELFVYAASRQHAEQALAVIESELREEGVDATTSGVEQWLHEDERWSGEVDEPTFEEELLAHGYAPWEVRIECDAHDDAEALADRLGDEGYGVIRRWRYVIVGTETREEAEALAERLHGEAEPSSRMVWEVLPQNPFAVFGGLGGTGTPL